MGCQSASQQLLLTKGKLKTAVWSWLCKAWLFCNYLLFFLIWNMRLSFLWGGCLWSPSAGLCLQKAFWICCSFSLLFGGGLDGFFWLIFGLVFFRFCNASLKLLLTSLRSDSRSFFSAEFQFLMLRHLFTIMFFYSSFSHIFLCWSRLVLPSHIQ